MRSEDRVDERREALDGGGKDQDEPEQAEEHRQRHQPALARAAAPQAARQFHRVPAGGPDHDQPPMEAAAPLQHHAYSLIDLTGAATRLVTTALPATS